MTPEPDPYQDSGATRQIFSSLRSIQTPADFEQGVVSRVLLNSLPTLSAPPSFETDVLQRIQQSAASEPSQSPESSLPRTNSSSDSSFSGSNAAPAALWKYGLAAIVSAISIAALWYWSSHEDTLQTAAQQSVIPQAPRASTSNTQGTQPQRTLEQTGTLHSSSSTTSTPVQASQDPKGSMSRATTLKGSAKTLAKSPGLQRTHKDSLAQFDAVRGAVIPKDRLDEE